MKTSKAVVLLSGGLDSVVSLGVAVKTLDVRLALTFDYGQEAFQEELLASEKVAKSYEIEHKVITLDFLKGLIGKDVWVPNRNALFLNIAGSYCDALCLEYIVFGANAQEARDFSDNSKEFVKRADALFEYSAKNAPKVFTPLLDLSKEDIVALAISENIDLSGIKSCYNRSGHCGECASCKLLKEALLKNGNKDLLKLFF